MTRRRRPAGSTRREFLQTSTALGAVALLGSCGGSGGSPDDGGGGGDALGPPEIAADLWQTMAPYVRASAAGTYGTRINLYNPASVPSRVVIQLFDLDGALVDHNVAYPALPGGHADHIELADYLVTRGLPGNFTGTVWVGTTPESGLVFMGLQGITFDWYGPSHLASVHGMRDFGNSNHDSVWSDLIHPHAVGGDRYVSRVAIHNASGDGTSESLVARPEVIVRDDDGGVLVQTTLDAIPVRATRLVDLRELVGAAFTSGTVQIREPDCGLVALGFVFDDDNGGIVSVDHYFDRHFVVDTTGFTG